tara:strand:- start:1193 stop:1387 length:195 start_codon:yes stop_codon:yes gene_type:complete
VNVQEAIAWFKGKGSRYWTLGGQNDFYDMAQGGNAFGVRESHYPDWQDSDFQHVIIAIDGEYEL